MHCKGGIARASTCSLAHYIAKGEAREAVDKLKAKRSVGGSAAGTKGEAIARDPEGNHCE